MSGIIPTSGITSEFQRKVPSNNRLPPLVPRLPTSAPLSSTSSSVSSSPPSQLMINNIRRGRSRNNPIPASNLSSTSSTTVSSSQPSQTQQTTNTRRSRSLRHYLPHEASSTQTDNLRQELERERKDNASLREKLDQAQNKIETLLSSPTLNELHLSQHKLTTAEAKLAAAQAQMAALQSQLTQSQIRNEQLIVDNDRLKSANRTLRTENRELSRLHAATRGRLEAKGRVEALQTSITVNSESATVEISSRNDFTHSTRVPTSMRRRPIASSMFSPRRITPTGSPTPGDFSSLITSTSPTSPPPLLSPINPALLSSSLDSLVSSGTVSQ